MCTIVYSVCVCVCVYVYITGMRHARVKDVSLPSRGKGAYVLRKTYNVSEKTTRRAADRVYGSCMYIIYYNPTPPLSSSSCRVRTYTRLAAFNHERRGSESGLLWFANAITIIIHYNCETSLSQLLYGRRSEWFVQVAVDWARVCFRRVSAGWFEHETGFENFITNLSFFLSSLSTRVEHRNV